MICRRGRQVRRVQGARRQDEPNTVDVGQHEENCGARRAQIPVAYYHTHPLLAGRRAARAMTSSPTRTTDVYAKEHEIDAYVGTLRRQLPQIRPQARQGTPPARPAEERARSHPTAHTESVCPRRSSSFSTTTRRACSPRSGGTACRSSASSPCTRATAAWASPSRRPARSSRTCCGTRAARCWSRTSTGGRGSWCSRARPSSPTPATPTPRRSAWPAATSSAPPRGGAAPTGTQYDRIAAADKRVTLVLRPEHIYGSALARLREAVAK
mgnify:CR=1 FL=1